MLEKPPVTVQPNKWSQESLEDLKKQAFSNNLDKKILLDIFCQAPEEAIRGLFKWDEANNHPLRGLINTFNSAEINHIFNEASAQVIDLLYHHCQPRAENHRFSLFNKKLSHLSNESICKLFWGYGFDRNDDLNRFGSLPFPQETQSTLITALLVFTYTWFGQLDVQAHIGSFFRQKANIGLSSEKENGLTFGQCDLLIALYKHIAGKGDQISRDAYQSLLTYLAEPSEPFIITLLRQKPEDAKVIIEDENLLNALTDEAVFRIFAAIPSCSQQLSKKLFAKIPDRGIENVIKHIDDGLFREDSKSATNARSAFLLNFFLSASANNDQNKLNELKRYFDQNPDHFSAIFSYSDNEGSTFSPTNILKLAKTIITNQTSPELIRKVFLALHSNCPKVEELLVSYLTPQEILKLLIEAAKERIFLSGSILLKKLDFKLLPSLIEKLEPDWNTMDADSAKYLMEMLYKEQYYLQEERFGFSEFFSGLLSFFYGVIYYSSMVVVVGIILYFAAPSTRPAEIYRRLKEFFNPPEIIKESIVPPSFMDPDFDNQKTAVNKYLYAKALTVPKADLPIKDSNLPEANLEEGSENTLSKALLGKHNTLKKVISNRDVYLTPFHKERIETKCRFVKQQKQEYKKSIQGGSHFIYVPGNRYYIVWGSNGSSKRSDFLLDATHQEALNTLLEINRNKEQEHYGLK